MNDSDNKNGHAGNSGGGDQHIPASDFARRRVADILRREKPRQEQEDASWNLSHHMVRMLTNHTDNIWPVAAFTPRQMLTFNCFPGTEGWRVVSFRHKLPLKRKLQAANFQSKFFKAPSPNKTVS